MQQYTVGELQEALRAIASTLLKCEKAQTRLKPGRSHHTLLVRRIKAFQIAAELLERELAGYGASPDADDSKQ